MTFLPCVHREAIAWMNSMEGTLVLKQEAREAGVMIEADRDEATVIQQLNEKVAQLQRENEQLRLSS